MPRKQREDFKTSFEYEAYLDSLYDFVRKVSIACNEFDMIQTKEKEEPHWTEAHITKRYIAWDETGADYVGIYLTVNEARQALIKYAKTLKQETVK